MIILYIDEDIDINILMIRHWHWDIVIDEDIDGDIVIDEDIDIGEDIDGDIAVGALTRGGLCRWASQGGTVAEVEVTQISAAAAEPVLPPGHLGGGGGH